MMKNKYAHVIKETSDRQLIYSLYLTQGLLLLLSFIIGIFLFEDFSAFLNLFHWQDTNIYIWGGTAGIAVVLLDLLFMKILPNYYYDDGGLNERIFCKRSFLHIAVIAFIVSVSEEVLFRGVIQTHYGFIISSFIFAFVHVRYLFNWFLFLNVIGMSFLIGIIYAQTENLLVTIFMHFIIDFSLGCIIKFNFLKKHDEQEGILDE
jgi:uncharacterized protein